MIRPKAVVLEADPTARETCSCLLREVGFDSLPAESEAAAVALLESGSIDLVVGDFPGADGSPVIRCAREARSHPGILLLTAANEVEPAVGPLRAAGFSLIAKPIDPVAFGRAVGWLMHARHLAEGGCAGGQTEDFCRLATTAASVPDLPHLLDELLSICLGALGASTGSVMMASRSTPKVLSIVASRGLPLREHVPVPFGARVAGWVAESRRAIRLTGSLDGHPQFAQVPSNPIIAASIVAPIVFRDETLGTLSVSATTPNRLLPESLALIVSAADIAAGAIHRSRLEQAREHQDRLAVLGHLSASLVHELNNPLSYVSCNLAALVELLSSAGVAEAKDEVSALLRDTTEGVQRMIALTQNLKLASRKSSEEFTAFDLNEVLLRAAALVQPQFKHRLSLTTELEASAKITGDAGRILQVVINLLVNAAQAVQKNGWIVLRSRTEVGGMMVEVEDNGPGIPPELGEQLFEPFFTTKPEGEGTGLGLSISRQIAAEHGGTLSFVSPAGRGACFQLRLPTSLEDPPSQEAIVRPDRCLVLVVDDEPALLRAMVRVFEKEFEVMSSTQPEEALQLAVGKKLDLVVTDFSMPGKNGVGLIEELRSRGCASPAILVTAVVENDEISQAITSGVVSSLLRKPWAPSALLAEARRLVRLPDAGR